MMIVWTTRDGRKIPVKDMDDQHLTNALAMVERTAKMQHAIAEGAKAKEGFSLLWGSIFKDELVRRIGAKVSKAVDDFVAGQAAEKAAKVIKKRKPVARIAGPVKRKRVAGRKRATSGRKRVKK